jgi:feruloyl-CoA synthase
LFGDLVNTNPEESIQAAHAHVHADTVFKILFTRGTKGAPKGAINTHRMWATNQEMVRTFFAFLEDEPPVLVSGLPWSRTIGGNGDVGLALYNAGSLYLDDGDQTLHNLRVIAPTVYCNVPEGFEALMPYLRKDPPFRKHFFSRLKLMYCAGGAMQEATWNEMADLSAAECGERVLLLTGLGATETAGHALFGLPASNRPGLVGVPAPGVELKLVPNGAETYEARLRGPNVTPGYWRRLSQTRAAFDEEGFLKLGDTLRFSDEGDASRGFLFAG